MAAYPPNSWPSITGVASIRCVRPDLTTSLNSSAFASRAVARWSSAGTRSRVVASTAATWIEVGKVSLLDWLALTWSLGWHSTPPRDGERGEHLVHVHVGAGAGAGLEDVDRELVVVLPRDDLVGPLADRVACSLLMMSSSALILAADFFTRAMATMWAGSRVVPLIGKFSTARWVWARQRASLGTSISPMLSCSVRVSPSSLLMPSTVPGADERAQPVLTVTVIAESAQPPARS